MAWSAYSCQRYFLTLATGFKPKEDKRLDSGATKPHYPNCKTTKFYNRDKTFKVALRKFICTDQRPRRKALMLNLQQHTAESQTAGQNAPDSHDSKLQRLGHRLTDLVVQMKELQMLKADVEAEILMIVGHEEEGNTSISTDEFKFTTTGKLTRKVTDIAAIQAIAPELLKEKFDLDLRKFKKLAVDNPALYKQVSDYVETKSAKPAIKLEFLD